MASASTGWRCTHSASVVSQDNTSVTIRVSVYWQNDGWRYDIGYTDAWVYCNGQSHQVMDEGYVNTTSSITQSKLLGSYDFKVNKTTASQSIQCYGKISTHSGYVNGTKSSTSAGVSISAKPSYTVTYNANGGTGAPGNQTKWYGTTLTLSSSKPTRTGYTFLNWNRYADGSGNTYTPGGTFTGNYGLNLYAMWKANTYTVSYNANGGTGAPGNQTKTYGTTLKLSTTKPTRTNYNFLGWSTSASGSVVYASGANYTNNSAVTLYAVWELAYTKPRLNNFAVRRCTSSGTASESGTYLKVTFSWATDKTVSSVKIQYRPQSTTIWSTTTVTASGTSSSVSKIIGAGTISSETSYYVMASVSDSGGTTTSPQVSIGTIKFPIDVRKGGNGVAIGKVSESDIFDVGMEARFRKKLVSEEGFNTGVNNGGIFDTGADGATYDVANVQVRSWYGIGFAPSITGQSVPQYKNAAYINVRTGDFYAIGNISANKTIYTAGEIVKNSAWHQSYRGTITDFNLATKHGFYFFGGNVKNAPVANGYGSVEVVISRATSWSVSALDSFIWQICRTTNGKTYMRFGVNDETMSGWTFMVNAKVLYDNSSGTTGTVTLSETVASFDYLEIYYTNDGQQRSMKVASPNGKVVMLDNWIYEESTTYLFTRINKITISGTSITRNLARGCAVNGAEATFTNEWSRFTITKVVGYR